MSEPSDSTPDSVAKLQDAFTKRVLDVLEMHASVHEDTTGVMAAIRTPGTVERAAFFMGCWAAFSASTMVYRDEGLLRPPD